MGVLPDRDRLMYDPDQITTQRRCAELEGSDAELLRLRCLERASEALPPIIDGVRRCDLLWADAISSTWTGWEIRGGRRVLLRCLRRDWQADRVMRRRMARAVRSLPALLTPTWHADGDWPHLRLPLGGPLLAEGTPSIDEPGLTAGILTRAVAGLASLHGAGLHLGGSLEHHIVLTDQGPEMLWLDRFDAPGAPQDDLRGLGLLADRLSPEGLDALADMVADWADTPPPTAMDGAELLRQSMSHTLLTHRHRLRRIRQTSTHLSDIRRLQLLVERLSDWPPPTATACLSANDPAAPVLVRCDGITIRGGPRGAMVVVYSPDGGIDPQRHRQLARDWRRRSAVMEPTRRSVQRDLGGQAGDAENLMRWMKTCAELRTLRLLMERAGST
ncbi:MAG: hypothetical protein ACI8RZ_004853 [Myxococcota bacterium]|jgi:hypothetical protein